MRPETLDGLVKKTGWVLIAIGALVMSRVALTLHSG
jgi:hypothetical protein